MAEVTIRDYLEPGTVPGQPTLQYVKPGIVPSSIPVGRVLMHNYVAHDKRTPCGERGFRAWVDIEPWPGFTLCRCGWSSFLHYSREIF
jgi:hypothetical protein